MSEERILYFTAEHNYLYRSAGGALELEARFSGDDEGVNDFREYLRGHRGALFSVLADLAGEDFHEDQIPVLRGGDREAVVQRRLAQRYPGTRPPAPPPPPPLIAGRRRHEPRPLPPLTTT